jgi:hypothetical protein
MMYPFPAAIATFCQSPKYWKEKHFWGGTRYFRTIRCLKAAPIASVLDQPGRLHYSHVRGARAKISNGLESQASTHLAEDSLVPSLVAKRQPGCEPLFAKRQSDS